MKWSTQQRRVDTLKGMAINPRKLDKAGRERLLRSLRKFDLVDIPVVNADDTIISGHQRVAMLLAEDRGAELIDVRVPDRMLTEAEVKEYMLQANTHAGTWDEAVLQEQFADVDLSALAEDVATIINDKPRETFTDPDDVPEPPAMPVSALGDVWLLGEHRLMCGDSTDAEMVKHLLAGAVVDTCLTDPPYGLDGSTTGKNNYAGYNDTLDNLEQIVREFLPIAQRIAPVVVLTPGNKHHRLYPAPTWTMAWFVPSGKGSGPWGFCCWQPILCYGKDPMLSNGKGSHPDAIVHIEGSDNTINHPCAKPIKFWTWLMDRSSLKGAAIFDPFSGSGTTIIAAEMTGRKCCAMEITPIYVDVAVQRWQKFTGKAAVLEGDGRSFNELSTARADAHR